MTIVSCPKCTQPLDLTGVEPNTVVQCVCGAKLRTPKQAIQNPAQPAAQNQPGPMTLGQPQAGQTQPAPTQASPVQPGQAQPNQFQPLTAQDPLATPAAGSTSDPLFDPAAMASIPSPQMQVPTMPAYQQPYQTAAPASQASADATNLTTSQRLGFVNQGVVLVFWGMVTQIIAGLAMFVLPGLASTVALGGKGAVLVGYIFSLYAPKESDSRKFIIAGLIVIGLGGVLSELALLVLRLAPLTFISLGAGLMAILFMASYMLSFASVVLYLYFLKTLAGYTKQPQAADEAQTLAFQLMILCGAGFVVGLVLGPLPLQVRFIFSIVVGIAFFVAQTFWMINFLQFLDRLEFRKRKIRKSGASTSGWGAHR